MDANSTAPTQCQDTPVPVMLPIPLMWMDMHVMVGACECMGRSEVMCSTVICSA